MPADSGQAFISRNRAPRVHISYQDPYNADRLIELPFVMGVMSDLSGNNAGVEAGDVASREFLEFDVDNFDKRMAAIEPGATFNVANKLGDEGGEKLSINLRFKKMEDFSPAAVARQVEPVRKLLEAREQLTNLLRYMDGRVGAEEQLKQLLNDPALMASLGEKLAKEVQEKLAQDQPGEDKAGSDE